MRVAAGRYRAALGVLAIVFALTIGVFVWMTSTGVYPSFIGGALVGGTAVGGVATILLLVDFVSGNRDRRLGLAGEQATGSLFGSRRMKAEGWSLVHGVPFQGRGDIDHVAFGPVGVLAIESKWTTGTWALRDGTLRGPVDDPIEQVLREADRLERFLDSRGARVPVTPVLVVWGRGCELETGREWAGRALVLSGPDAKQLPALLCRVIDHEVAPTVVERARNCISDYLANNPETKASDHGMARLLDRVRV